MKEDESIHDMHTHFSSIINELHSLGEIIPTNRLVRKILCVLPSSWESKVNAITEAKDLQTLTIDELIDNRKTYEMKRKKDLERREPKMEKSLVLKATKNDASSDKSEMAYLTRRFHKIIRRNGRDYYKNADKTAKRNQVLGKKFNRKYIAYNLVKQALVAWGDSSNESEDRDDLGDTSMLAIDNEPSEYESIFALMARSNVDDDNEKDEVNIFYVQKNLKKINALEQVRDDLVVTVVDLKEQVEEVTRENSLLQSQMKKWMNTPSKGKQVASETHLELENKLKKTKISLTAELKRNRQLQMDLKRVKIDLDKSLHWTRSSDVVADMYRSNGERKGWSERTQSKMVYE
ncbi:uncharacterized protein LOC132620098 [Lycium barbarum]|uniref:uncharacterized protein LOC132620098 n=1 Tax=Lycium barbarum TaxID=112863 RepID=UPI00293E362F|nr:uncharacterized protein LOC132620098 [Lycium barbarum]